MGDYTIAVHIHQSWVRQFNERAMKLCFATCVSDGNEDSFNVIAFTSEVYPNIDLQWSEKYRIAGSSDRFTSGANFNLSTEPVDIRLGENYTVTKQWSDRRPAPDPNINGSAFRFTNEKMASAVVYKTVNGSSTPVYFSPAGPFPPGSQNLTPRPKCRFWFRYSARTGAMNSNFSGQPYDIDMTGKNRQDYWYNNDGTRSTSQPPNFQ